MSEFHDILTGNDSYGGNYLGRLVDRQIFPHEQALLREWRASQAAPAVAQLAPAAMVVEEVPAAAGEAVVPMPRMAQPEVMAQIQ